VHPGRHLVPGHHLLTHALRHPIVLSHGDEPAWQGSVRWDQCVGIKNFSRKRAEKDGTQTAKQ
jgi:hypothetical protein